MSVHTVIKALVMLFCKRCWYKVVHPALKEIAYWVDKVFSRNVLIQSFVTGSFILAAEYWTNYVTLGAVQMGWLWTFLFFWSLVTYAKWDSIEGGLKSLFTEDDDE